MNIKLTEEEISILKEALYEASSYNVEEYCKGQADKSIIGPSIKKYATVLRKLGGEPSDYIKKYFPEV